TKVNAKEAQTVMCLTRCCSSRIASALVATSIVLASACGPKGYIEPITKFQDASSVVIASTRTYLTELNKTERDNYILGQAGKKEQIRLDRIEEVQVFGGDRLKVRLDALGLLAGYGNLLSKLANNDAPERIKGEATDLGNALKNLVQTTNGLTGNDDKQFKAAIGPVATIVGEVLSFALEQKIKRALDKAIQEGEAPVNSLLAALRIDVEVAYQRKRSFLSGQRTSLVDQYNQEFQKGTKADADKLRAYADQIRTNEDRWEVFASANPTESLDAMAKAHTALVKYAQSSNKISSLAALVEAMEAFSARAQRIGQAIQTLHKI